MVEHPRAMGDRAALGVGRGVGHAGEAGVGDRTGTHRAGLECDEQLAPRQPLVAERLRSGADGYDLGVSSGVMIAARRVAALADDRATHLRVTKAVFQPKDFYAGSAAYTKALADDLVAKRRLLGQLGLVKQ